MANLMEDILQCLCNIQKQIFYYLSNTTDVLYLDKLTCFVSDVNSRHQATNTVSQSKAKCIYSFSGIPHIYSNVCDIKL